MKQKLRVFLTLLLCAVASVGWGKEVTFLPTDFGLNTSVSFSKEKEGITIQVEGSTSTAEQIRIFKGKKITISSTTATITKIVFNCTANGTAQYGPGCFASQTGYSYEGKVGTWEGSASSVVFTASGNQVRVTSIVVTYTPAVSNKVATPFISGTENFYSSTEVSITCDTDGATIAYSTDDGNTWTNYDAPFTLTATTTVQAKATKSGMTDSEVASKTFTKVEPLANLAALADKEKGYTGFVTLTDALVTYVKGNNAYIEDATAGMYLYGCASEFEAGDKISGIMNVTSFDVYSGLPEVKGFSLVDGYAKTSGNQVTPTEVTIEQINSNISGYISRYIIIKGATVSSAFSERNCTIEQNGNTIVLRDQNYPGSLATTEGSSINVTGHGTIYNTTAQIAVYEQSQIEVISAQVVDPEVSFANETMSIEVGETTTNTLSKPADLYVTFSSSDNTVATVDENGEVTGIAQGEATITVSWQAVENKYNEGYASYTLTVTAAAVTSDVIDLRGKTEALTFNNVGNILTSNSYTSLENGSLTGSDNNIYKGWSGEQILKSGDNLQMKASAGQLVSPVVKSDKGVKIDVTYSENNPIIRIGNDESSDGSLSTGLTETTFTVAAGSKYTKISSITITPLTEKPKANPGLDYATKTINKTVGDENFTNELTNPNQLAVTFTSSKETVATVDYNGEVTIVGEGTTIITAAFSGNDDYLEGEASYTIIVSDPNKGTEANPYTVADIIDGKAQGKNEIYVVGYIVGEFNSKTNDPRTSGFTTDANIALADEFTTSPTAAASIPVALPTNDLKTTWGCKTNDGSTIGTKILVKGNGETYFSVNGIKNTTEVNLVATISAAGYATFANAKAVDFSAADGLTVMTAKYDAVNGIINYTVVESKKVPAATAVVLKGEAKDYTGVVIEEAPALTNNDLQVKLTESFASDGTQYCLAKKGDVVGFYKVKDGVNVKAGKAYLVITGQNAKDFYAIVDEIDGINTIGNSQLATDKVYNLAGQRVQKATKGVYIVNGKKVVIR